ncbi:MAG: beta-lactam-binding protein with PASTA domain [Planctomycetota bacterium]|jgi:beta-lactam-binding protein with PASTA domain
MAPQPEGESDAVDTNVVGSTVAAAQRTLAEFSDLIWQNEAGVPINPPQPKWIVSAQSPSVDVGKTVPTSTAITLTIGAPPPLF